MAASGNTIDVYTTQGGTNVTNECTFMTAAGNVIAGAVMGDTGFEYFEWGTSDSIGKIRYTDVVYLCLYDGSGAFDSFTCYLDQLTPEPEPVTIVSPAIYFGEILVGTAIDSEPQTPSTTNYLKLGSGVTGKYGDSMTGAVIEVGSGYDTSDLTNNPPIVYDSNGDQLTCMYFEISGSDLYIGAVIGGIGRTIQVTTYANPQTYTIILSGGSSN